MFQQIPTELIAAVIESAGELYLNKLAERNMAAVAELNYELLLRFGSALRKYLPISMYNFFLHVGCFVFLYWMSHIFSLLAFQEKKATKRLINSCLVKQLV